VYTEGIDISLQISYIYGLLTNIVLPPGEWICFVIYSVYVQIVRCHSASILVCWPQRLAYHEALVLGLLRFLRQIWRPVWVRGK